MSGADEATAKATAPWPEAVEIDSGLGPDHALDRALMAIHASWPLSRGAFGAPRWSRTERRSAARRSWWWRRSREAPGRRARRAGRSRRSSGRQACRHVVVGLPHVVGGAQAKPYAAHVPVTGDGVDVGVRGAASP